MKTHIYFNKLCLRLQNCPALSKMMLCLQRTRDTSPSVLVPQQSCSRHHSFTYMSEMAKGIKLQIYVTRRANMYFHPTDNMNDSILILLNKALKRTEFENAIFCFFMHQFNIKLHLLRCCCTCRKPQFALPKPSPLPHIRLDFSWTTFPKAHCRRRSRVSRNI